ncbi:MAG: hypothetical protein ACI4N3_04130 [Alphaproteobacteria bacterium]
MSNSKDVNLANKLISDLILNQKELDIEPLNTYDVGREIKRKKGESFYASINENGIVLHIYNNIEYLVNPNNKALFSLLENFINDYEGDGSDEDKEMFNGLYTCIPYLMNIPTWAAMDVSLLFEFATKMINYINDKYRFAINEGLMDETKKENADFEETTKVMEDIANSINKDDKEE